ncbi:hypothetical protein [[Mycobacterium] crassicus]|uniref:Uncharacterized protein n=1 Tax=[Mycobacterium] crassicus TaxID=2872309 RepID=A0ABU5XGP2_9MYCO|nr:hypothetical protein [Mycolicibacter sp. MYC098]MEB3021328.1 hypothetical protein [Mycolicibacter sp. MYC098]
MDEQLPHLADNLNLPDSLLLPVAFGLASYAGLKMLAEQFAPIAKVLGPLGRRWTALRDQRIAKAANVADLTEKVAKLTETVNVQTREIAWLRKMRDDDAWTTDLNRQVRELAAIARRRADRMEMIDSYVLADTEWHRRADLAWKAGADPERIAAEVPQHVPFLEFERRWHTQRALESGGTPTG